VLLVGWSTRALADAALRSGYRPRTVDFFGDLDQKRRVENLSLGRDLGLPWSPPAAARAAASLPSAPIAYGFDLENHPEAVESLAAGRELLGNSASVLRAVRDPARLFRILSESGISTPLTLFPGAETGADRGASEAGSDGRALEPVSGGGDASGLRRWLVKPLRGGGGRGVSGAEPGRLPGPDEMLQEEIRGPVLGFSFLADGQDVRPLAIATQIEDRAAFGAGRFAYVGSLSCLPSGLDETALREQALRAAVAVTRAFGLRGWNGLDFAVRNEEVLPLELNPRHTSSMELWDAASTRLFAAHVEACRGRIEGTWLPPSPAVRGKAVLFARRSVVVRESLVRLADLPDPASGATRTETVATPARDAASPRAATSTRAATTMGAAAPLGHGSGPGAAGWPERAVADVPHPGERIARGQPVCSLYAVGSTAAGCVAALRALADQVEGHLDPDATIETSPVRSDSAGTPRI
jgi:predicted ATP-grasp superfamily ATP-dependent carboligase